MTPDIDLHVGSRIREKREERRMSQRSLAALLGIVPQQISKIERGLSATDATKLYLCARALKVGPGWFFAGLPETGA